jgi:hypothetical protein
VTASGYIPKTKYNIHVTNENVTSVSENESIDCEEFVLFSRLFVWILN